MKEAELLNLRKIDCDLEGHPTPVSNTCADYSTSTKNSDYAEICLVPFFFFFSPPINSLILISCFKSFILPNVCFNHAPFPQKLAFVDVATGSLGQGLGAACGMAYTAKYFDKSRYSC